MIIIISLFIVNHPTVPNTNQKILVKYKILYFSKKKTNTIFLGEVLRGDRIVNTKFQVINKKKEI
jgi:hypothetical protein